MRLFSYFVCSFVFFLLFRSVYEVFLFATIFFTPSHPVIPCRNFPIIAYKTHSFGSQHLLKLVWLSNDIIHIRLSHCFI